MLPSCYMVPTSVAAVQPFADAGLALQAFEPDITFGSLLNDLPSQLDGGCLFLSVFPGTISVNVDELS